MEKLARSRPELVDADAILIADTGNIELGLPTFTTSLRGTGSVIVTVTTMDHPAHSGMFGGRRAGRPPGLAHGAGQPARRHRRDDHRRARHTTASGTARHTTPNGSGETPRSPTGWTR